MHARQRQLLRAHGWAPSAHCTVLQMQEGQVLCRTSPGCGLTVQLGQRCPSPRLEQRPADKLAEGACRQQSEAPSPQQLLHACQHAGGQLLALLPGNDGESVWVRGAAHAGQLGKGTPRMAPPWAFSGQASKHLQYTPMHRQARWGGVTEREVTACCMPCINGARTAFSWSILNRAPCGCCASTDASSAAAATCTARTRPARCCDAARLASAFSHQS